jgi:DNA-binding transcriptional ArsR family regulator
MSRKLPSRAARRRAPAAIFAALGDHTRLSLVGLLSTGEPRSISQLTRGTGLTRQAITKHLHVLARVGVVRSVRHGRESRFQFDPQPMTELSEYLDFVSQRWDQALSRLKSFVEDY